MLKKLSIALGVIFALLLVLIIISAVFSPSKAPQSQVVFTEQLNKLRRLMKVEEDGSNGSRINTVKEYVEIFINEPRDVELWYAKVESVNEYEGIVYIKAQYKEGQHDSYIDYAQIFTLQIFDSQSKKIVANLRKGDDIFFSGQLGNERSITFSGGLEQPEYRFPPTEIKLSLDGNIITTPAI